MTDKDIALARSLSSVIAAVSAVHIECMAAKTEGMTQDEFSAHVDKASSAVSDMFDAFNAFISAVEAGSHA